MNKAFTAILSVVLVISYIGSTASALEIPYEQNDILYYNKNASDVCTPASISSGEYKTIGPEIEVGATIFGGTWNGSDLKRDGGDDNGRGLMGEHAGHTMFAELSSPGTKDFAYLAKLLNPPAEDLGWTSSAGKEGFKPGSKFLLSYKGKSIVIEKRDVGGGGGPISGKPRAVDIWYETAKLIDFKEGTAVMKIQQVASDTPVTPLNGDPVAASTTVSSTNNVEKVLKILIGTGMTIEQAAGVAGNLIIESGSENINPAAEEFPGQDKGGYGIVQWTGVRWRGPQGLKAFAEYKNTEWTDINTQVEFILWEVGQGGISWNGKPGGAESKGWNATIQEKTVAGAAETWMLTYERPGTPHLDRRIKAAESVYEKYKNLPVDGTLVGSSTCGSSTVVDGDIAATAKRLAWPHRVALPKSTKPSYGEAESKPEYVKEVKKFTKSFWDAEYTDCGIFVATVMRASGVDPSYPARGTDTQLAYVKNSPKYKTFTASSEAELEPGDILIRSGHTYMYVGDYTAEKDGKTYKAVGASWHTRPPSGHSLYLSGQSSSDISHSSAFTIARYIGG